MATVTDLINFTIQKNAVGFKEAFSELMHERTTEKLDDIKREMSFNFFKEKASEGDGNEEV